MSQTERVQFALDAPLIPGDELACPQLQATCREGRYRVWESDTANYGEAQALTLLEAFRAEQVVYVQQRVTAIRAKGRASAAAYRAAYPEIQRFREHRAHLVAQARDPQGWAEKRRGENARYYLRAKARREHPESADLI